MMNDKQKIKHLYNRAGFGLHLNLLSKETTWQGEIDHLFKNKKHLALETISLSEVEQAKEKMKSMSKSDVKDLKQLLKENIFELNHLWLQEMINSENQLHEKMALFWHSHFACRSVNPYFDQLYLDIIRKNALGNFAELLKEVSKTPAMLQFLNNQQNKKDHPNENFARELMELFTLGRGNYTEQDIKEAARAFTGYGFDKSGEFKFRVQQHDFGTKTFQGKTGNFSGDDILQIILEKKECAYFITKKIYRFFVNENADEKYINELATKFYQSSYDIKSLMKAIFTADWFYDSNNIGVSIKSPVELVTGLSRMVPFTFVDMQSYVFIQRSLGQVLLNPPSVAGWNGGKSWIDSSSLLFRMRLPQIIYYDKEIDLEPKEILPEQGMMKMKVIDDYVKKIASKKLSATVSWTAIINRFGQSKEITSDLTDFLLANKADSSLLKLLKTNADKTTTETEVKSTVINIMTLPDYQLC